MFFHKKGDAKSVPSDDINIMTRRGMSDKDIIKALKSKGYSYSEIERAMLSAVKSGVSEEAPARSIRPKQMQMSVQGPPDESQASYDFGEEPPEESFDNMPTEDIFSGQAQQPQYQDLPEFSQEQQQPVEELVEGLVEEKWQKFQDEITHFEDSIERISADMKVFEEKMEAARKESPTNELEARMTELSERLDELDARTGGLERAFKQMLPNLTRNIESLSAIVNELKSKQEPRSFA